MSYWIKFLLTASVIVLPGVSGATPPASIEIDSIAQPFRFNDLFIDAQKTIVRMSQPQDRIALTDSSRLLRASLPHAGFEASARALSLFLSYLDTIRSQTILEKDRDFWCAAYDISRAIQELDLIQAKEIEPAQLGRIQYVINQLKYVKSRINILAHEIVNQIESDFYGLEKVENWFILSAESTEDWTQIASQLEMMRDQENLQDYSKTLGMAFRFAKGHPDWIRRLLAVSVGGRLPIYQVATSGVVFHERLETLESAMSAGTENPDLQDHMWNLFEPAFLTQSRRRVAQAFIYHMGDNLEIQLKLAAMPPVVFELYDDCPLLSLCLNLLQFDDVRAVAAVDNLLEYIVPSLEDHQPVRSELPAFYKLLSHPKVAQKPSRMRKIEVIKDFIFAHLNDVPDKAPYQMLFDWHRARGLGELDTVLNQALLTAVQTRLDGNKGFGKFLSTLAKDNDYPPEIQSALHAQSSCLDPSIEWKLQRELLQSPNLDPQIQKELIQEMVITDLMEVAGESDIILRPGFRQEIETRLKNEYTNTLAEAHTRPSEFPRIIYEASFLDSFASSNIPDGTLVRLPNERLAE